MPTTSHRRAVFASPSPRVFVPLLALLAGLFAGAGCRSTGEMESGLQAGASGSFAFSSKAGLRKAPGGKFCVSRQFRTNTNMTLDPSVPTGAVEEKSRFATDEANPMTNAYWMAVLSALSYEDPNALAQELKDNFGVTSYRFIEGRSANPPVDVQALVLKIGHDARFDVPALADGAGQPVPARRSVEDMAVVVFRGTELSSVQDIMADFRNAPVKMQGAGQFPDLGYVHQGFRDNLDRIWAALNQEVRQLGVPVWFTGHSMGASLATMAATRFMAANDPNVKVAGLYTFGGPRVGLKDFLGNFNSLIAARGTYVRVHAFNNDPVTVIPGPVSGALGGSLEAVFKGGWKHVGLGGSARERAVWMKGDGTLGSADETARRFNMLLTDFPGINKLAGTKDHNPLNYVLWTEAHAFGQATSCR